MHKSETSDGVATAAPAQTTILLLMGPPGCGKGTQSERISAALHIPAISTGDMIRAEIKEGTPLGKIAAGVTITGGLLSDDLVNQIVASRLSHSDCAAGFLLDGYPRSLDQAEFLHYLLSSRGLPQPTVIHIDVPSEMLVARTCLRRFCPKCGQVYNLQSHPPQMEDVCDQCGEHLQRRADDCEDTVKNRLQAYDRNTVPLIDYYAQHDYFRIPGTGTPDDVFRAIMGVLPA